MLSAAGSPLLLSQPRRDWPSLRVLSLAASFGSSGRVCTPLYTYLLLFIYTFPTNWHPLTHHTVFSTGNLCTQPARPSLRAARTPGGKYWSQANHLPKLSKVSFWPHALPETQPRGRGETPLFVTKLQALPWNNFRCLFHSSSASDVQSTRQGEGFPRQHDLHFQKGARKRHVSCSFVFL